MPELPEVETIRLGLQRRIIGLVIKNITVIAPKSFIGNPKDIRGRKVLEIWRKAKFLGIGLSNNLTLLFHLKMTGQLVYDDGKRLVGGHPTPDMKDKMPNAHTRVIFTFSDSSKLYFNDQRKFGWIKIIDNGKLKIDNSLKNLGPEPLEKGFTWQVLKNNLLKYKLQAIKVALMDQTVVSGVGNIYANEACFAAGLDPRTKISGLTDRQFQAFHKGVIGVIRKGIRHGGSTRAHFVDTEGRKGYFLDYAFVYGRDKHPCKICGGEIKKISLGGRGTYFCPNCQKAYNIS